MASKTSTPTKSKNTKDDNRKAAASRVAAKEVAPGELTDEVMPEVAAQITAGEEATRKHYEGRDTVNDAGRTLSALEQREADLKEMVKENEEVRAERKSLKAERRERLQADGRREAPTRVPHSEEDRPAASDALPGTGVADPRDLAPGQSVEPSPPGGVAIRAQPDKPGTPYSKL